ncbi:MAG TPA: hypothetical protein VE999_11110 [Gemmataceae bacterium]|nr:hypothetical protein [Gemmataceae bacterium]
MTSPSLWGQAAGEKEALGKAALAAYAANVESFTFYKCRYRHTRAQARSIEDAIRGDYINARFYDNRLIVDDSRDLYEGFAPPPDPKQARPARGKKGSFVVPSPGFSDRYLADGKREMSYSPVLGGINLYSVESNAHGIELTPLGVNFLGHRNIHGPNVRLNQPEKFEFSVDGFQEIDGRPVITVRLKDKEIFRPGSAPAIEFCYTYSFDPARGHFPIRIQMLWNGKPKTQVFVTRMRECSNQRWFPERSVEINTPDKEGALYDVLEIKLLELDADHRPDKSEFYFNIPAGTQVLEFAKLDGRHFFTLKQEEKITIDDIPKLFELCEKAADTPLMDTAIPHSSSAAWIRWSVGVAGLILVAGGVYHLVRRFWLKRVPA